MHVRMSLFMERERVTNGKRMTAGTGVSRSRQRYLGSLKSLIDKQSVSR